MDQDIEFGLRFHGVNDVTFTLGPLAITSISTDEIDWGSFEVVWGNKFCLYCHLYKESDPYKMQDTGYQCPEWSLERIGPKAYPKYIWSSNQVFNPIWDWYHLIKNKFSAQG